MMNESFWQRIWCLKILPPKISDTAIYWVLIFFCQGGFYYRRYPWYMIFYGELRTTILSASSACILTSDIFAIIGEILKYFEY